MRLQPEWIQALGRARDPVYVVNDAQRIICWNAGAQKLLGYSEDEVLNQPCYQVIGGKVCGKSWCHAGCAVQRSLKHGMSVQNVEMQARTKSGDEVWLNASVFTLERKKRRFSIHLLRDLTCEKHTEEALESFLDTLHFYGVADGNHDGAGDAGAHKYSLPSDPPSVAPLTRREIQVLELLAEGLSTKDLAKQLGVSPFTIRSHIASILLKTGVHTQAQAVAYAYRARLL